MKTRLIALVLGCLGLGGCITPLVGLGVQLGAEAIGAGIDAASGPSEPDVEAHCWDPEKQSASTSTSPNCWSPQVKITEDEYDKFKETGVAPSVPQSQVATTGAASREIHCVVPSSQHYYILRYVEHCPTGDVMVPEAEWQKRKTLQLEGSQVATAPAPIYCWDSDKALEYQLADGQSCGSDHRITEEQYRTQRARREEADTARAEQQAQTERSKKPPTQSEQQTLPAAKPEPTQVVEAAPDVQQAPQASIAPQQIDLDSFEATGSGTGFFVSSLGHVLTNHHVIAKCDTVAGITPVGIYEAPTVNSNAKFDLAVLKMPIVSERFATFSATAPEQGDDVYVIGFPLLGDFREIKITDGIVSGLSGPDHDTSLIQMTAAVQPGNSGGPLVSQAGSIVGVVVGKYTGEIGGGFYAEGINFAVAHEAAATFLKLNGIEVKRSASATEMKNRDLMKRAEQWTIPLLCMKNKASG